MNKSLLLSAFLGLTPLLGDTHTPGELLVRALYAEEGLADLEAAVELYKEAYRLFPNDPIVAATAAERLASCYDRLGRKEEAESWRRVLDRLPRVMDGARPPTASPPQEEPWGGSSRRGWNLPRFATSGERRKHLLDLLADVLEEAKRHQNLGDESARALLVEFERRLDDLELEGRGTGQPGPHGTGRGGAPLLDSSRPMGPEHAWILRLQADGRVTWEGQSDPLPRERLLALARQHRPLVLHVERGADWSTIATVVEEMAGQGALVLTLQSVRLESPPVLEPELQRFVRQVFRAVRQNRPELLREIAAEGLDPDGIVAELHDLVRQSQFELRRREGPADEVRLFFSALDGPKVDLELEIISRAERLMLARMGIARGKPPR